MSTETVRDERSQSLLAMCLIALTTGIVTGIGAWLFRLLIGGMHNVFFLRKLSSDYDANAHTPDNPWGVAIIAVPVIGSVGVVWLVKTFAPEAKGHGVPEVVDAIHYNQGRIRGSVALVKSLASAICIGSGGSVGREGPIVQIGSAFASMLGQILRLPTRQRITLIAAGAAAGIAATFNAPMGGILFAIEVLLVSINIQNLLPVALATVTAGYIGQTLMGTHPAFDAAALQVTNFHLYSSWVLLLFIFFGALMGIVSVGFIRGIYWAEDRFDALPCNDYLRHALGMACVGVMTYGVWRFTGHYHVQGIGYATIMDVITGVLSSPGLLLLLCLLKFAATTLTLGSGGSGGIFSPAIYIGATLGAGFAHLGNSFFPAMDLDVVAFTLAGMAASVGATTGAFLTGTVMLHELTSDNNVVLPVILATITACGVRKTISAANIYSLKLLRRRHIVPDSLQSALDDARCVRDVSSRDFQIVSQVDPTTMISGVVVVEDQGRIVKVIHPFLMPGQGEACSSDGLSTASAASDPDGGKGRVADHGVRDSPASDPVAASPSGWIVVGPDTPVLQAMRQLHAANAGCALVIEPAGSQNVADIAGVLTLREIGAYHTQLAELL